MEPAEAKLNGAAWLGWMREFSGCAAKDGKTNEAVNFIPKQKKRSSFPNSVSQYLEFQFAII
jgi:hypothetical protein